MPAIVAKRLSSHTAELLDVSVTGAKIRGHSFLEVGEELVLKAQGVEVFGKVIRAEMINSA